MPLFLQFAEFGFRLGIIAFGEDMTVTESIHGRIQKPMTFELTASNGCIEQQCDQYRPTP